MYTSRGWVWATKEGTMSRPEVNADQPFYGGRSSGWYWQWCYRHPEAKPVGAMRIISDLREATGHVRLTPGVYDVDGTIELPDDTYIDAAGCIIHATCDPIFRPRAAFSLTGAEIHTRGKVLNGWPLHQYPVTFRDCTLHGGELWFATERNMLVERCRFYRSGAGWVAPGAVWYDNDFYGPNGYGAHAMQIVSGPALLCRNRFHNTSRGIVLQGSATGVLALDTHFKGIRGGEGNANEVILLEGNGLTGNAFIDFWISDSAGAGISLFGRDIKSNIFWGGKIDVDSIGIWVSPDCGVNTFMNLEVSGGADLRSSQFICNTHFLDTAIKIGNAGPYTPNYESQRDLIRGGAIHKFSGCSIIRPNRTVEVIR